MGEAEWGTWQENHPDDHTLRSWIAAVSGQVSQTQTEAERIKEAARETKCLAQKAIVTSREVEERLKEGEERAGKIAQEVQEQTEQELRACLEEALAIAEEEERENTNRKIETINNTVDALAEAVDEFEEEIIKVRKREEETERYIGSIQNSIG